jgi:hypothetical protein
MTRWVSWSRRRSHRKIRDAKWHVAASDTETLCGYPIAPEGDAPWYDDEPPAEFWHVCRRCRKRLNECGQ